MARTPEINQDHIRKAIKYRPRRSYIVRDAMFLKVVSDEVVNVQSYEAVIAQLQVNGNEVVGAAALATAGGVILVARNRRRTD